MPSGQHYSTAHAHLQLRERETLSNSDFTLILPRGLNKVRPLFVVWLSKSLNIHIDFFLHVQQVKLLKIICSNALMTAREIWKKFLQQKINCMKLYV